MGNGCTAELILSPVIRRKKVFTFTLWPLYSGVKNHIIHWRVGWVGPRTYLEVVPFQAMKPWSYSP
jgi:hypothetical protein